MVSKAIIHYDEKFWERFMDMVDRLPRDSLRQLQHELWMASAEVEKRLSRGHNEAE